MVRMLRLLSVLVLGLTVAVFALIAAEIWSDRSELQDLPGESALERFRQEGRDLRHATETPALVREAELFARYLNPPQSPNKDTDVSAVLISQDPPETPVRAIPISLSPKFKVCGTSFYPAQPERSMALISEPGLGGGLERWVKEGDQVGHFVIHEIRRGVVVARSGDRLQEMTVEPVKAERGLVRGTRTVEPKLNAKQDTGKDG